LIAISYLLADISSAFRSTGLTAGSIALQTALFLNHALCCTDALRFAVFIRELLKSENILASIQLDPKKQADRFLSGPLPTSQR
jgi:hypothetical protein